MAIFNKKTKTVTTGMAPARQNMWVVWLLSIITFIVTVLIVLGLFWAGRWAVRQFTKDPAPAKPAAGISTEDKDTNKNTTNNRGSNTAPSTNNPPVTPPPVSTTPRPVAPSKDLVNTGPTSDE